MAFEVVYTSAVRGLRPGSSGFCTVACTRGMPPGHIEALEQLSAYKHLYEAGDPRAHQNPTRFSHYRLNLSGKSFSVISRVAFAGFDHTGRTNKLAHHLLLSTEERRRAGPAAILLRAGVMRSEWNGEPAFIEEPRRIPEIRQEAVGAIAWQRITGDAGWAAMLASTFAGEDSKPTYIILSPGIEPLELILEAMQLLPEDVRWRVGFNTFTTDLPGNAPCHWRCCFPESPILSEAMKSTRCVVIDLRKGKNLGPAPNSHLAEVARFGNERGPAGAQAEHGKTNAVSKVSLALKGEEEDAKVIDADLVSPDPVPNCASAREPALSSKAPRRRLWISAAVGIAILAVAAGAVALLNREPEGPKPRPVPKLSVSPDLITLEEGHDYTDSVTIANNGDPGSELVWEALSDNGAISVQPSGGKLGAPNSSSIVIKLQSGSPRTMRATLRFYAPQSHLEKAIAVIVKVPVATDASGTSKLGKEDKAATPRLPQISAASAMQFAGTYSCAVKAEILDFTIDTPEGVSWKIKITKGEEWLRATPLRGQVPSGGKCKAEIAVDTKNLKPGKHQGGLTIHVGEACKTIDVSVTISRPIVAFPKSYLQQGMPNKSQTAVVYPGHGLRAGIPATIVGCSLAGGVDDLRATIKIGQLTIRGKSPNKTGQELDFLNVHWDMAEDALIFRKQEITADSWSRFVRSIQYIDIANDEQLVRCFLNPRSTETALKVEELRLDDHVLPNKIPLEVEERGCDFPLQADWSPPLCIWRDKDDWMREAVFRCDETGSRLEITWAEECGRLLRAKNKCDTQADILKGQLSPGENETPDQERDRLEKLKERLRSLDVHDLGAEATEFEQLQKLRSELPKDLERCRTRAESAVQYLLGISGRHKKRISGFDAWLFREEGHTINVVAKEGSDALVIKVTFRRK